MKTDEVHLALSELSLPQKYLQREIAVLTRKTVRKADPYSALVTVLLYLYCIRDEKRFRAIFDQFVAARMDQLLTLGNDLWFYVEWLILMELDLTGNPRFKQTIWDQGFYLDRLNGSSLELHSRNLKDELTAPETGYRLPKDTILSRYKYLVVECLLMIHFNKSEAVTLIKNAQTNIDRYRRLYVAAVDGYRLKDEQFLNSLKQVSKDLF